jgi:hypothetical protein
LRAAEAKRGFGDHAALRRLAVEAVLRGRDGGEPGRPVRVVQHELAREQQHLVGNRGGADRRQHVGAVDDLVDRADDLRRIAAVQLAVARRTAVAAVAKAPLGTAHRDERLERRVEARRRLAHLARLRLLPPRGLGSDALLLALVLGLAPLDHLRALLVLAADVHVLALLRERQLRRRTGLRLQRRGGRARDRAARLAADRERPGVGAFEQAIGSGVAARAARVAGGVLPLLDVDDAVGAVDAVDEVAGERGDEALVRAPRRRVVGRERDRGERSGDVFAVLSPDELDVVGARPLVDAVERAERNAVDAAVQQAAARPVRLGLDDRARLVDERRGRELQARPGDLRRRARRQRRARLGDRLSARSASLRQGRSTPASPGRRGVRAAASRRPRGPRRAPSRAGATARAGCSRFARRRADRSPVRSTSRRRGRRAGRLRCRSARPARGRRAGRAARSGSASRRTFRSS